MFDTINGIPVHPLVVHAVVVLLPLAVFGAFAIVVGPGWRKQYGVLVVLTSGLATLVAAVASGVQVYRVGDSGARAAWGQASHGASAAGQVPGR